MPRQAEPMRVAGVILAAGASRRMGTNKMRLKLQGEPLVRRATRRALAAGLSPVVVVVGNEADAVCAELDGLPYEAAFNSDYVGPTSSSLHRGLQRLQPEIDAAVVLLGDMVHITEAMLSALVSSAGETGAPLVVSQYGDVTAPPLLFRSSLFPELLAWTGEGCGKAVVQRHRAEAVHLEWPVSWLADVDTPEDFAAVREALEGV